MRRTMLAAVAVLALTTAACDGYQAGPEEAEAGTAAPVAPRTATPQADPDQAARAALSAAAASGSPTATWPRSPATPGTPCCRTG